MPGGTEIGRQTSLVDSGCGVGGVGLDRSDDAGLECLDGDVPRVANVVLVTDEGLLLVNESLARLRPDRAEQTSGVAH